MRNSLEASPRPVKGSAAKMSRVATTMIRITFAATFTGIVPLVA